MSPTALCITTAEQKRRIIFLHKDKPSLKRGLSDRSSKGKSGVDLFRTNEVYMERTSLTEEVYCLSNVCAHTQLIECLIYNMCAHVDYKNPDLATRVNHLSDRSLSSVSQATHNDHT
ncbi:uncharacterized protein ASPGLDRAFT_1028580 [Aspergillus glaucus CBS 516.65]|uniref:Uncharacterized protein n=1 Tax=Aspergillus glaucus CBS 516.65 TaxID=1160497 RepID=A0A1L9VW21_ASPGL|nr:hypothetical protein ASPGLDRAFT_1028580 [Aspergillus glaucus CBS 516.65]OJJ88096.1 hypothetical protein ASPGLDRAFT_1028580 [Aspergillus glaucus CBS 516.65]